MSMYENLVRLKMTAEPEEITEAAESQDLARYCIERAKRRFGDPDSGDTVTKASSSMHFGILIGLAYAAEFGAPGIVKKLFTLEAEK